MTDKAESVQAHASLCSEGDGADDGRTLQHGWAGPTQAAIDQVQRVVESALSTQPPYLYNSQRVPVKGPWVIVNSVFFNGAYYAQPCTNSKGVQVLHEVSRDRLVRDGLSSDEAEALCKLLNAGDEP